MLEIIIIETIYLMLVAAPCLFIFYRISRIYNFSSYRGLRYFSLAFLYLAFGFFIRYFVMLAKIFQGNMLTISSFGTLTLLMEYFLVLPGLLFLYSLVWQRFEKNKYSVSFSLFQSMIYVIAFLIALLDMLMNRFLVMYSSQIALFTVSAAICLARYRKNKNNAMRMYFISMVLFLIVWIINLIAQYTIDIMPIIRLYAYLFTVSACAVFLYMTIKLTRDFR